MQKRTEITIETERFLVVSQRRKRASHWCNECANTVLMLTVDEAARTAATIPLEIFRLVEAGLLHFATGLEGRLFICSNSLASPRQKECSSGGPDINPTF